MSTTPTKPAAGKSAPHHRPAHKATRQMIWFGGAALFLLALYNARHAPDDSGPLWRVFVGIIAWLYLWWLATLLFDLVFVWHRYIRHAVALTFLRAEVQRPDLATRGDSPEDDNPSGQGALKPDLPPVEGSPVTQEIITEDEQPMSHA